MANFLLIGATSGIGHETTKQLLSQGHKVFITSRSQKKIEPFLLEYSCPYALVDATNFEAVDKVFEKALHEFSQIDGVVNFAGTFLLRPAHLMSEDQYNEILNGCLKTSFAVVRAAGKHMVQGGSVVLLSSAAALQGISNHEAVAAAKAGVIGLTLSAAATYASINLRFNAVAPGLTDTPLTHSIVDNPTALKVSQNMHALGRIGKVKDIASAISFFLNPENNWITGQVLAVDGGISRVIPKFKV